MTILQRRKRRVLEPPNDGSAWSTARAKVKSKPVCLRESKMIRSESHKQFVRGFVCAIFGKAGHECEGKIECAHVRIGTDGGTSLKPSDSWTIPLCAKAHAEQHRIGERSFETKYSIRMKEIAEKLWRISAAGIKHRREAQG